MGFGSRCLSITYGGKDKRVNSKAFIVRIVKPAEEPKVPKKEFVPIELGEKEKNLFQKILSGLGISVIIALGIFLLVSFFNIGINWKDILILVGIPLALGIAASYLILT